MAEQKLELIVDIDETGAIRGIKNVETSVGGAGKAGAKAGADVDKAWSGAKAVFLGIAAVVGGKVVGAIKQMAEAGLEFLDLQDDFQTVFKGLGKDAMDARDRLVSSFGLSTEAATKMLAQIGILTQSMGFNTSESLKMSENIAGLADAWEKYNPKGLKASQITDILAQAMNGQTRGLKELGISLKENEILMKAQEMGLGSVTGELTTQERAQVVLAAVTEKSTKALEGQKIENESLADRARRLNNQLKDLKTAFGIELASDIMKAVLPMNAFGGSLQSMQKIARTTIDIITALVKFTLLPMTIPLGVIVETVKGVVEFIKDSKEWLSATWESITKPSKAAIERLNKASEDLVKSTAKSLLDIATAPIATAKSMAKSMMDVFNDFTTGSKPLLQEGKNDWKAMEEERIRRDREAMDAINAKNADVFAHIAALEAKEAQDFEDMQRRKLHAFRETFLEIAEIASEVLESIGDIENTVFQNRMNEIEMEARAREEMFDDRNIYSEQLLALDEEERLLKIAKIQSELDAAIAAGDTELAKELERELKRINLTEEEKKRDKQIKEQKAASDKELAMKKYNIELESFRFNKVLQIAMATIDTAAGVAKNIGVLPLAILTGVLGAIQIGLIAAQPEPLPPKFAMGGTLGGAYASGDVTPFMGNRGETILNVPQGQNLFNNLERSGLLSPTGSNSLTNNNNSTYNQQMGRTINIFGPVTMSADGDFQKSVDRRLSAGGTFT